MGPPRKPNAMRVYALAITLACTALVVAGLKQQVAVDATSTLLALQQVANQQQQQQQQQQQLQQDKLVAEQQLNSVVNTANQQQQLQQQQQQQLVANTPSSTSAPGQPAKSNHRLVNKLMDARHRRRNRHNRHRLNKLKAAATPQSSGVSLPGNLMDKSPQALQSQLMPLDQQPTLVALESIVEEVARAGMQQQQLPPPQQSIGAGGGQQQRQSQSSGAPTASEILLGDNSASQMTHLRQAPGNREQITPISAQQVTASTMGGQQQQQPQTQTQLALLPPPPPPPQSQPPMAPINPLATRGTAHNSRGFFLTSMLSKIMNVLNVTEFALEMRDGISSRASCMACNAVVGLFLSPLYSKEVFSAAIRTVCTSFKIQTPRVCFGVVEAFQDDFEYIRKNTKLTRDEVCGVVFGVDCARRPTYNLFWTVPIPDLPSKPLDSPTQSNGNNLNLGTIPLGEHSTIDMEDAPDMFEYRKSSAPTPGPNMGNNTQSLKAAESLSKQQQQQQPPLTSQQNQQQPVNGKKSAKMMKRPQYIFDDDHLLDNQAAKADQQMARSQVTAAAEATSSSGGKTQDEKFSSFVQITDIHIDPYYETGSLNDCGEPLCCRATSGLVAPNDKRRRAGQWGDYGNCDVPIRTLRNALERIREQHSNAEYWLWTGDISPHDIWNISKSETTNHVRLVSKMVREYSNGVPVFPVIGNHEAHPVNSFAPPEIKGKFSMSWLYDVMAEEWSEWLPADAIRTFRIGGFYKLQVRKGFRIIALNTNYCARLNPWSFFDPVDPANQLKWLADELLEAELNQDKVHIIGHVPPDNRECTQAWLFNFINIVDRFKDTILAQFYGHTHRDEWRIIYSMQPQRQEEPIGIQYIGPSITPFTENNPAYRIYHQDKTGNILDSETYYFNLTEANATPTSVPKWRYSYSTRHHLNMTNGLSAIEWNSFLQRMHDDDNLFDSFYGNFYRFSEPKANQVCRSKCKYSMLSDLRLSHPYKTKPKPFFPHRKMSNHHGPRERHERGDHGRHNHHHHHHHHKRLRYTK